MEDWIKILVTILFSGSGVGTIVGVIMKHTYKKKIAKIVTDGKKAIETIKKNRDLELKKEETKQIKIKEKAVTKRLTTLLEYQTENKKEQFNLNDIEALAEIRLELEKKFHES